MKPKPKYQKGERFTNKDYGNNNIFVITSYTRGVTEYVYCAAKIKYQDRIGNYRYKFLERDIIPLFNADKFEKYCNEGELNEQDRRKDKKSK